MAYLESDPTVNWKIPPEVQAQRDDNARALRAKYEDSNSPDYNPDYNAGVSDQIKNVKNTFKATPVQQFLETDPVQTSGKFLEVDPKVQGQFLETDPTPQSTEPPGTLAALGQAGLSSLGGLAHAGMVLGGGLAGLVSTDAADAVFGAADKLKHSAETAILSPEEQQAENLPQKIVGGITGAVPYIAAAPFVGPGIAAAGMGTVAFTESASDLLKKGVDLKRAEAAGLVEGAGAAALGMVPGVGKTIGRTLLLGAGTNIGQEAATDAIVKSMFPDRPDIQKEHEFSWEKTAVSGAVGAALGAGFHGLHTVGEKAAEIQQRKTDAFITDKFTPLVNDLIPDRTRYTPQEGRSARDEIIKLAGEDNTSLTKFLDLLAADEKSTPVQRQLADVFSRLSHSLGLDNVKVTWEKNPTDPLGNDVNGLYTPDTDSIKLRRNTIESRLSTLLHEAAHAITYRGLDLLEKYTPDTIRNKSLAEQQLYARAAKLKEVFDYAKKRYDTELEPHIQDNLASLTNREVHNKTYGFQNIHEFVSEHLTNPAFNEFLKSIKIHPDDLQFMKSSTVHPIKNLFQAAKTAMMRVLGMNPGNTLHDVAYDHVTNFIEDIKAQTRHNAVKEVTGKLADQRSDFREKADNQSKTLLRKIGNVLKEASTKDEVAFRLNALSRSQPWRDWVANNVDRLWDNTGHIIDAMPDSEYKDLPPSMKKFVNDDRSIDEMIHSEFPKNVSEGKVFETLGIKEDLEGSGRRMFSPTILSAMKNGPGGTIMRWVYSKANDFKSMTETLYQDAIAHFAEFHDMKRKDQLKMMDVISYYDSVEGRRVLTDRGKQWIPDDILKSNGLNDAQISAYHNMTKGLDFLHSMLNQALIKMGKEPLPQVPGYMPHVWNGAYKVLVKVVKPDNTSGKKSEYVVMVKAFHFRQQAEKFVKRLNDGTYDEGDNLYRPVVDKLNPDGWRVTKHEDIQKGLMAGIQEHVTAYRNGLILEPEILQKLEKIDQDNLRGISKHILERSDVGGYIGQQGAKDGFLEAIRVGAPYNNKLLTLWQNYAKSTTEFYRNTLFTDEVANRLTQVQPLSMDNKTYYYTLMENTKEIKAHLDEFNSNFTGENHNELKFIDNFLQARSIELGIDPLAYRKTARLMRNFLSMTKLRSNPGNYIANGIQPVHALAMLNYMNTLLRQDGMKTPDPMRAFARMVMRRFNPDPDMAATLDWARDNGHLAAQLENELHSGKLSPLMDFINTATGGKINPAVESFSRTSTFMVAYEHFRNVWPDNPDRARKAAVSLMEMTMVNYDHMSRPLMYQNYGVAGESISPFAVFRNGYVGNFLLLADLARRNPLSYQAWKPLLIQQMTFLTTAGITGVIGASEYNLIVNQLNSWFPELFSLPTIEELFMKGGFPDAFTFGVLSASTKGLPGVEHGVSLGSSMNAVGMDDTFSSALLPFVNAIATTLGLTAEKALALITDNAVIPSDVRLYKAGKQLVPGILQGYWDKWFMEEGSNVAPKTSNLAEGGYEREQSDWNAINWFGRRSLVEQKESGVNRIISLSAQQRDAGVKKLVEAATNHTLGLPNGIDPVQARARAIQIMDNDPEFGDKFDQMVANARANRLIPERRKEANMDTAEGAKRRSERKQLMGWE